MLSDCDRPKKAVRIERDTNMDKLQASSQEFFMGGKRGFNVEQLLPLEIFDIPKSGLPYKLVHHMRQLSQPNGRKELGSRPYLFQPFISLFRFYFQNFYLLSGCL